MCQCRHEGSPCCSDGHEFPATRRQLLQELPEIPSAEVTNVNTPQQLVAAIGRGDRDIVVTDHLDLTTVPLKPTGICLVGCMSPLGVLKGQTRSIRVCIPLAGTLLKTTNHEVLISRYNSCSLHASACNIVLFQRLVANSTTNLVVM